jgi:hypothetical protein
LVFASPWRRSSLRPGSETSVSNPERRLQGRHKKAPTFVGARGACRSFQEAVCYREPSRFGVVELRVLSSELLLLPLRVPLVPPDVDELLAS